MWNSHGSLKGAWLGYRITHSLSHACSKPCHCTVSVFLATNNTSLTPGVRTKSSRSGRQLDRSQRPSQGNGGRR
jgi:hypothetical protein